IGAAALAAAGSAFVAFVGAPLDSIVSYWPGINPGPPGIEFSSSRCMFAVHLRPDRLTVDEFRRTASAVASVVDAIKPSWMQIEVGVGTGSGTAFIPGKATVGLTFI